VRCALVLVLLAGTVDADVAGAHGPCDCLRPAVGPPGTKVSVTGGYPAYKVTFNPDRSDLLIGPERLWREHREAVPPVSVFRRVWKEPSHAATFRVPDVPPGRYLVGIYHHE
jgi:hypothetical protein